MALDAQIIKVINGNIRDPLPEALHRIANPTADPVVLIEVQLGTYFGEDDIVRIEDDYRRS